MKRKPDRRIARSLGLAALLTSSLCSPGWAGTFNNNFNSDPSAVLTTYGNAQWVPSGGVNGSGYISLTDAINSQNGSIIIEDFDNGAPVAGFVATFKLRIGGGTANAADGFSFNWATDLPNNTFGEAENGAGTGITVGWDIYDNGGGEAPSIDVKVGGVVLQSTKLAKADIMTDAAFVDVRIEFKDSKLNVDFKGKSVYKDLLVVFPPISGGRFGLGARTGGENANQWVDDLNIQTSAPSKPVIGSVSPNAKGFWLNLLDVPNGAVDASTVSATFDGTAVKGTATKSGDKTTFVYEGNDLLAIGSTHTVVMSYKFGASATSVTTDPLTLTIPSYIVIPAASVLPSSAVDTSKRGFIFRLQQVDSATTLATSNKRAEEQISGLLGPNVADPNVVGAADGPASAANPANAPIEFKISSVINLSQVEGSEFGNVTPDLQMPGVPGIMGGTDSMAAEILAALEFPAAGPYTMIVNSDDGFKTSAGKDPRDISASVIGAFDAGRGSADTTFQIYVEAPGIYGFRTLWEEGGGDANVEWLTQLPSGAKVLINDTAGNAQAIKAYQLAGNKLPAFVRSVSPGADVTMINRPATVEAVLVDGSTQVTSGSVTLKLNGAAVAVTVTKTGSETKVVHTVPGDLLPQAEYTAELSFTDTAGPRTASWKFKTGPLSSKIFVIEAEDFDYDGGKANPQKGTAGLDVDVMPYYGGAYDGLGAIKGVDYNNDDGNDGSLYRTETDDNGENEVSMSSMNNVAAGNGKGGTFPINSSDRAAYTTTVNYSIGWVGNPDWENYTRTFPDNGTGNWWKIWGGLSYGDVGDGQISASVAKVSAGVGTTDQTLDPIGAFSAPGSGGWGNNNLIPLKTASGTDAMVKLVGKNTIRVNNAGGDFDFIIFSAAPPPPPYVEAAPQDSCKRNEVILDWTLRDTDSKVNASTVKVYLDSNDVSSKATVTKTDTGATVHLDLSGQTFEPGDHPWRLTFSDTSAPVQNVTADGTMLVNPYPATTVFTIEAEDFNFSTDHVTGGKNNPQKGTADMDINVMPYIGGAYEGLSAIKGVDYNNADGNDSDVYRTEKDANGENEVNVGSSNGNRFSNDRGAFELTANYKIGWVAPGDWANYTRTFPKGDYNVWAALSYDGRGAGQLSASLDLVTSDPSKPDQIVKPLGAFNAPGSGGWSRNELVPMKDTSGKMSVLSMEGTQTVRFNMSSGDFDYVIFVPATAPTDAPKITSVRVNNTGGLVVEWTGGGILQTASSLLGPWTDIPNSSSPYTLPMTQKVLFTRIKR